MNKNWKIGVMGLAGESSGEMSTKWCRWRDYQQQWLHYRVFSSGLVFFLCCLVLYGSIGILFGWFLFNKPYYINEGFNSAGCQEDNEGSWSIGAFYGDSPFSLKSIESVSSSFLICAFISIFDFSLL